MRVEEACKIAVDYFSGIGEVGVRQVLDAEQVYSIYPGTYDEIAYGGSAITIHKETEEVKRFIMPSREAFALLKIATEVEVPEEYIYVEEENEDAE